MSKRLLVVWFAVASLLLLLAPASAAASASPPMYGDELLWILFGVPLVEVAIPDTRVELGTDGEVAADFSWPLVLTLVRVGDFDDLFVVFGRAGAEAHHTSSGVTRGVFTGRADVVLPLSSDSMGLGLYGEGGYVVGGDGNGAVAGGGAIMTVFDGIAGFLVMYRASLVDGVRHDVTLNFEIALPLYLLYQELE